MPVVMLFDRLPMMFCDKVIIDDQAAAYEVRTKLIDKVEKK
jgi:DNA-binding LacI/PurR family transcriptional regulator